MPKIHLDIPSPDEQDIRRHMDFGRLKQQATTLKRRTRWKKWMGMGLATVAALVTGLLLWQALSPTLVPERTVEQKAREQQTASLRSALPPQQRYALKPQGDTLVLTDGSRIEVPRNAIVRQDGSQPQSAELLVRLYKDPLHMLAGGISMRLNERQGLESAGMIEVWAKEGDDTLKLQKPLQVHLAAHQHRPDYRLYKYDNGNWTEEKQQPRPRIRFRLLAGKDPAGLYRGLQNLYWEAETDSATFRPYYNEIELSYLQSNKVRMEKEVMADEGRADSTSNTKRDTVKTTKALNLEAECISLSGKPLKARIERHRKAVEKKKGDEDARMAAYQRATLLYSFSLSGFGIYNCDRPIPWGTDGLPLRFVDQMGRKLEPVLYYLVEGGINSIREFASSASVPYDAERQVFLWMITAKDELCIARPEDWAKAKVKDGYRVVKVKRERLDKWDNARLREILGLPLELKVKDLIPPKWQLYLPEPKDKEVYLKVSTSIMENATRGIRSWSLETMMESSFIDQQNNMSYNVQLSGYITDLQYFFDIPFPTDLPSSQKKAFANMTILFNEKGSPDGIGFLKSNSKQLEDDIRRMYQKLRSYPIPENTRSSQKIYLTISPLPNTK